MQALGAQGFAARGARHGDYARGAQAPPPAAVRVACKASRSRVSGAARAAADATVLAADIGGTNARYQLWRVPAAGGAPVLSFEKTYPTALHATFEASLDNVLKEAGGPAPSAACFAAAGPVVDERCAFTNLSWVIDAAAARKQLRTPAVRVVNDFEAVGYGIAALDPSAVLTLNAGQPIARAPVVVLGPGTGLGQAVLTWEGSAEGGRYRVWPSEGSHADFAPRGPLQRDLAAAMEAELGECEVEQVCCGAGIVRIYNFLRRHHGGGGEDGLSPADVTDRALRKACPLCVEAVDVFLQILGAECSNLGLKLLARGGVYIAGGIPGKLLPLLRAGAAAGGGALERGFVRAGCRFEAVRRAMPLHVVLAKDPGLDGARSVALQALAASK